MTTNSKPEKLFEKARAARIAAVQAVFQMEHSDHSVREVCDEFIRHRFDSEDFPHIPDPELFKTLVRVAHDRQEDILPLIKAHLTQGWTYERIDSVLRALLCVSIAEFLVKATSLPAPVLISEYVDIARGFLPGKEPSFVNSVLDQVARSLGYSMNA